MMVRRARPLLVAATLVGVIVACEEQLDTGIACPALCPQQSTQLRDTIISAVVYDTSISGFPPIGTDTVFVIAVHGDTLDTRGIVRFDTLPASFQRRGVPGDSPIVAIDSAFIKMRVAKVDTAGPDFTIEVYDSDTALVDDTATASLVPTFVPARFLGSRTFNPDSVKDSIMVPIDGSVLLGKIQQTDSLLRRLRIGFRAVASSPVEVLLYTSNGGYPPILFVRASPDTNVLDISMVTHSATPEDLTIRSETRDFMLVAKEPSPAPGGTIRVGGLPGRRGYLRFSIPTEILDSSDVVRASLLLTQRPTPSAPNPSQAGAARAFEVVSSGVITNIARALIFLGQPGDSVDMAPGDSGVRSFEVVNAVRRWRFTDSTRTPRAIALRSNAEATSTWQTDFFGVNSPAAVQPRLRLTYIPQHDRRLP